LVIKKIVVKKFKPSVTPYLYANAMTASEDTISS